MTDGVVKKGRPKRKIQKKNLAETNACNSCGSCLQNGFYKSDSFLCKASGHLFICKECVDELWKKTFNKLQNEEYAIFKLCQMLDYPFYKFITTASMNAWKKRNTATNVFSQYLGLYKALCTQKKLPSSSFLDGESVFDGDLTKVNDLEITPEIRFKWGNNFDPYDYEFLQTRYIEYCRHVDTDIRTMESLVEEICHIELSIRKAREERNADIATMKSMNDILQKLLTSAGLDSKSKRELDNSDLIDTYGMKIKEIEEHEPCEIFENRNLFEDHDSILSYFKKYLFRPLKNLVLGTRDFNISADDLSDEYSNDDYLGEKDG